MSHILLSKRDSTLSFDEEKVSQQGEMVGGTEGVGEGANRPHLLGGGKTEAADQLQLSFSATIRAVASRPAWLGGVEDVVDSEPVRLEGRHLAWLAVDRPQAQPVAQTSPLPLLLLWCLTGVTNKLAVV